MSTTKKTGGWAAVGEILVGLFGLWVKSKPPSPQAVLSLNPITLEEHDGAALMGVSDQDLLTNPRLRARARALSRCVEEIDQDQ